jgi:hypothetical protein
MSSPDRVLLPLLAKPTHYKLELTPDLVAFTFDANEEVGHIVLLLH